MIRDQSQRKLHSFVSQNFQYGDINQYQPSCPVQMSSFINRNSQKWGNKSISVSNPPTNTSSLFFDNPMQRRQFFNQGYNPFNLEGKMNDFFAASQGKNIETRRDETET